MARYTNFFLTGSSQDEINNALLIALEACELNLIYQDPVCIVAKERPGRVSYTQLATVELLITPPTVQAGGAKVDLVVKNEELPLRRHNHCHEVFLLVNQAIADVNSPQSSQQSSPNSDPNGDQNNIQNKAPLNTEGKAQSKTSNGTTSIIQHSAESDIETVVS